jgi:hypothetical protein
MKAPAQLVLLGLVCLGSGCGADDGGNDADNTDTSSFTDYCRTGCETAAPLMCADTETCAAECVTEANQLVTMYPNCEAQVEASTRCIASRPAADWECNAQGEVSPKADVCAAERDAARSCVSD